MRRRLLTTLCFGALLVAAFFVYTFVLPSDPSSQSVAAPQPKVSPSRPVQTVTVQHDSIMEELPTSGTILAEAQVDVFPKIAGYIQKLLVEEGDKVTAGQVIVHIADTELRANLARASAEEDVLKAQQEEMRAGAMPDELAQAESQVHHAAAELANAAGVLERTRALAERGLQPMQELDNAKRRVTQAQAQHNIAAKRLQLLRTGARSEERQALQARRRAAQASQRMAEMELQNTIITAPMDGIVSHRHIDSGTYVTTTKTPIVTLVDMATVKVRVPVSERDIGKVHPGLTAQVYVDAYPEERFTGKVRRVSPTIDPTSHLGEVEITLTNSAYRLKPGMFAKVALILEQRHDVVVIPREALHRDGERMGVFLVQDGMAHLREVALGLQTQTQVEIREGLAPGAEIIVAGHTNLKDQTAVRVVQTGKE